MLFYSAKRNEKALNNAQKYGKGNSTWKLQITE